MDQVVVNHGTRPLDELYFELKPASTNLGAVDYGDLIAGRPQSRTDNEDGRFQLFRIGDAVAARNTHAAIYDALSAAGPNYGLRDFGLYAMDSLRLDKGYRGWKTDIETGYLP